MNLVTITAKYQAAVIELEMANDHYKLDREDRNRIARFLRALRRCDRLRKTLKILHETGNL